MKEDKKTQWQNSAFFRLNVCDSPAPVRLLIQMMNQEIGWGNAVSSQFLMATDLQVWGRHLASKTNVDRTTNIKCNVFRCTHYFISLKRT